MEDQSHMRGRKEDKVRRVTGTLTCATSQHPVRYWGDRQVNGTDRTARLFRLIGIVIEYESFRGLSLRLSIWSIPLPSIHSFQRLVYYGKWKCATFKHAIAHFTGQCLRPICDKWYDQRGGERCFKPSPGQFTFPPWQRIPPSSWACCLSLKCASSWEWTVWAWCLHIWLPGGSVDRSCATELFLLIQTQGLWFGQMWRSAVSPFLMGHELSRNVPLESLSFCTAEL